MKKVFIVMILCLFASASVTKANDRFYNVDSLYYHRILEQCFSASAQAYVTLYCEANDYQGKVITTTMYLMRLIHSNIRLQDSLAEVSFLKEINIAKDYISGIDSLYYPYNIRNPDSAWKQLIFPIFECDYIDNQKYEDLLSAYFMPIAETFIYRLDPNKYNWKSNISVSSDCFVNVISKLIDNKYVVTFNYRDNSIICIAYANYKFESSDARKERENLQDRQK